MIWLGFGHARCKTNIFVGLLSFCIFVDARHLLLRYEFGIAKGCSGGSGSKSKAYAWMSNKLDYA